MDEGSGAKGLEFGHVRNAVERIIVAAAKAAAAQIFIRPHVVEHSGVRFATRSLLLEDYYCGGGAAQPP